MGNNNQVVSEDYYNKQTTYGKLESEYTKLGPFETFISIFKNNSEKTKQFIICSPKIIESKLPLIIFANGTGINVSKFIPILEHLASYGFIVAGNEDTMSGYGTSSSETLDFMIKINEEKNNIFFNKIEIDNVGISGHSQGGAGAINAVTKFQNSKNYKALFTASCMSDYFADTKCYEIKMINIPYFAITSNGFFDESCIGLTNKNFDILNENLINVCAVRKGVNHGDMLWAGDGYMTAWFCYILKGDKKAKEIFCGKHPEIENNNLWDNVRRKNCEN